MKEINKEGTKNSEIDSFNMYFLKEVKKQGNKVLSINSSEITFITDSKYTFKEGSIYLNDNIKISDDIDKCVFSKSLIDGKTIIKVNIKAKNSEEKTIEYVLNDGRDTYNYEDESSYTKGELRIWRQTETGITDGSVILQIGDKVAYDELSNGEKDKIIENTENGGESSSNTQQLRTEDLEWRVLGVDKEGHLELISTKPTTSKIFLKGTAGYLNGEIILNDTCNELYGKGKHALSSRNLNVNDINKIANYDPKTNSNYRRLYEYGYSLSEKCIQFRTSSNEGISWSKWTNTQSTSFTEPGKNTIDESNPSDLTLELPTNISKLESTTYQYTLSDVIANTTPDGISIDSLISEGLNDSNSASSGTNKSQWLSSGGIGCNGNNANFNLFSIRNGRLTFDLLWRSDQISGSPSYAIRPVITIKSQTKVSNKNSEGVYELLSKD